MSSNYRLDWRYPAFRQKVTLAIDESLKNSPNPRNRHSQEIEQHIFAKATSRESYMTMVARIILALSGRLKKGKCIQPTKSAEGLEDLCIKAVNKLVKKKDIDKLPLPQCVKNCIKKKRTST